MLPLMLVVIAGTAIVAVANADSTGERLGLVAALAVFVAIYLALVRRARRR
jgi:hypothetical protein